MLCTILPALPAQLDRRKYPNMVAQIAMASLLLIVTTIIHSLCTVGSIRVLNPAALRQRRLDSVVRQALPIAQLVLLLFLASVLEASVWATAYVGVGAIEDWESALYFSIVTYTTLGYGDVTLDASWRLMASLQAANGTIMFGWTTALIVYFVQRLRVRTKS